MEMGTGRVNSVESGKGFILLPDSRLYEAMDVGLQLGPSVADLYIADAGRVKLK